MDRESTLRWIREAAASQGTDGGFDLVRFLADTAGGDVLLFLDAGWLHVYSVLLPLSNLKGSYVSDLLSWDTREHGAAWGFKVGEGGHSPLDLCLAAPIEVAGEVLSFGEPVTESWTFRCRAGDISCVELSQEFKHLHGLSYDPDKGGYFSVQGRGAPEEAVSVRNEGDISMVTMRQGLVFSHLEAQGLALVRFVDSTGRVLHEGEDTIVNRQRDGLFLRISSTDNAVWARGIQILKPRPVLRGGIREVEIAGALARPRRV
jgi:hypothetical protein